MDRTDADVRSLEGNGEPVPLSLAPINDSGTAGVVYKQRKKQRNSNPRILDNVERTRKVLGWPPPWWIKKELD